MRLEGALLSDTAGAPWTAGPSDWTAVVREAAQALDRRLARHDEAPLLVALSGGGDSTALLLATLAWARRAGRRIVAATVDHRLAPQGAAWAEGCRRRCESLGLAHLTLVWEGPRPAVGLAAAARAARHRLLAQAARASGASVILMGHTADDAIEAALMREAGATTPTPRLWAPSPAWPAGRDLFLLRPLLGLRRATLRRALASLGEAWIEDPANADPESLRVRARAMAAAGTAPPPAPAGSDPGPSPFEAGPTGDLWADVGALATAPATAAHRWLGAALLCAGGRERPARSHALRRILAALSSGAPFAATLAGARLSCDGARLVIVRETGDARAGAPSALTLRAGETGVWDGRFEIEAGRRDVTVMAMAGRLSRLPKAQQQRARRLHPLARGGLPALIEPDGATSCPVLDDRPEVSLRCLVMARLAAACGAIDHETAIVAWRTCELHPKSIGMSGKRPVDEPS